MPMLSYSVLGQFQPLALDHRTPRSEVTSEGEWLSHDQLVDMLKNEAWSGQRGLPRAIEDSVRARLET